MLSEAEYFTNNLLVIGLFECYTTIANLGSNTPLDQFRPGTWTRIPMKEGNMLPVLTDRENQVLNLIAAGLTNREISRNLSISEATVENHTHHIYRKLGVSRRAQAVLYALRVNNAILNNVAENRGNPS